MAVGAKNFPTSLDTVVELVEVTNDASTALNGALTNSATTITVDSTSLFPSSGIITIDSENISYTGKTGTTFTGCTRGAESTTAATHDDNATVELLITAALPNVHAQSIIAIETKLGINSSTPSSGTVLRGTGAGASDWGAIVNADISASAAIDATKIADGSISNAEFQYLNGVTSAIQTQLDAKQAAFGSQTANTVYAGPTSGGAASPSFRALVAGDLPSHTQGWSTITSTPTTLSGYGITDAAANGAVTSSGLTMATARLLGRSTASTGAIEEITVGSGLTLSAGTLSASGGGSSPGGSGSELQFRGGASTFSAVTGSSVSGANVSLAPDATTGNGFAIASSTISSGNLVSISATGTAAASNGKHALLVATSGANATSTQTTYGAEITNTSTGTSSTNIALQLTASGGSTNTALNVTAGQIAVPGGSSGSPSIIFGGTQVGFYAPIVGEVYYASNTGGTGALIGFPRHSDNFFRFRNTTSLSWVSGAPDATSDDLILRRAAAANLAFGAADAASPVAQTQSVQNVAAGTSNTAGVDWTRDASRGTGTGAGGKHIFRVAGAGSSGTSQNSLATVLQLTPAASAATGLEITSNAAGSGVTLTALSSGSNESIFLLPKGTGLFNPVSTVTNLGFSASGTTTANYVGFVAGGTMSFQFGQAEIQFVSNGQLLWGSQSNTFSASSPSAGILRAASAVLRITDGSTGAGAISSVARTPSQITSDQNNYAPGVGLFQRWSTDASRNVTGRSAGQAGEFSYVWNAGSNDIVLVNESASSTAANRFTNSGGADITLAAGRCALMQYDTTSSRWRVVLL